MNYRLWCLLGLIMSGQTGLGKVMIIGHRGAHGTKPENTLVSFEKAIDTGADMIELDVRLCASGQVVVIHDDTVDRTTNGTGAVADLTLEQLKELDAGEGQKIVTLAELFDFVDRRVKIDIELKEPIYSEVAALINYYMAHKGWQPDDFLVSSYYHGVLLSFHDLCSKVPIGFICDDQLDPHLGHFKIANSYAVVAHHVVDEQYRMTLKRAKIPLMVYTVNDPQAIKRLLDYQIAGIISDYPERVKEMAER